MGHNELRSAAASYPHLRGLLSIPPGALMIVAALGNWEWGPLRHPWLFAVCCVVAGAGVLATRRFYDEHYGRMRSTTRAQATAAFATVANVALVLGISLLARSDASWSLDLPVNGLAAALAAGFLTYHVLTVGPRMHHLIIWGAVLVAGVLPLWGGAALDDTYNAGLVIAGAAAILSGVFDHRLLTRGLGPARGFDLRAGDLGA